jgi:hypothetical protein
MDGGMIGLLTGCGTAVVVIGALVVVFVWMRKSGNADELRIKQAIPGSTAKVIALGNSYVSRTYGSMSVGLRLEITPPFGESYQVISVWEIQPVHAPEVQVGKTFPVKVDAKNPKIIYPDVPWAEQPDPTEFTEDDFAN